MIGNGYRVPSEMRIFTLITSSPHSTTRHGDEYQCSCGLAWTVGEDDPHPTRQEVGERAIEQIRKGLDDGRDRMA